MIKIWVDDGVYRTAPVTTTVLFKIYRHAFSSGIRIFNYSSMHLYFLLYSVFLNRVTPKTNTINCSGFISDGRSIKLLLFVWSALWCTEQQRNVIQDADCCALNSSHYTAYHWTIISLLHKYPTQITWLIKLHT